MGGQQEPSPDDHFVQNTGHKEAKRQLFSSIFCIFVVILAVLGITFVFILHKNQEEPVLLFAPIINYFQGHANSEPKGDAYSGEDGGSNVLPEAQRGVRHDPLDPPLGIIPQHEFEPNFPDINSEAGHLVGSVRILCCITTTKGRKKNAMAVKQTWGNRCNKVIFISTEEDTEVGSIVLPEIEEGNEFSWGNSKVILEHLWTEYGKDFDWFLKADDMSYVVVENLRHFLSQGHSPNKATFFGCLFDTFINSAAGFVLSREALRKFVQDGLEDKDVCSPSRLGNEDLELLSCLKNLGTELGDSRDESGRHRFLPYTPERHLIPEKLRKTFWFWQNLYSPHKEGMECCSDTAISFHHIEPYQMIVFHFFLFHLRPVGLSLPKVREVKPKPPKAKLPTIPKKPSTKKLKEIKPVTPPVTTTESDDDICDLRTIPRHLCHCSNLPPPRSVKGMQNSTCSNEATTAGTNQKVISYSLFSGIKDGEKSGGKRPLRLKSDLEASLKEAETFYPDWVVRVYTDISLTPANEACDLICAHPTRLFWCDVSRLPELGDKTKMAPRTWRLLPLGDPTVETFISRDLERSLSERERTAVAEWEAMKYPYHIIRDYPEQYAAITGNLYGVRNSLLGTEVSKWMQTTLIEASEKDGLNYANGDDAILNQYIYESHKNLVLAHDSFTCSGFQEDGLRLPFPTQREGGQFVGQGRLGTMAISDTNECPRQCRPSYGKDWTFC